MCPTQTNIGLILLMTHVKELRKAIKSHRANSVELMTNCNAGDLQWEADEKRNVTGQVVNLRAAVTTEEISSV